MTNPSPDYRSGWNEALSAVLKRIGHWRELTYAELRVAIDSLRLAPLPPAEECPACEGGGITPGTASSQCGQCFGTGRIPLNPIVTRAEMPLKTTPAGSSGSNGTLSPTQPSESGGRSISDRGYEKHERHADDWHEWSVGIGDGIEVGKPARLFVRMDGEGSRMVEVTESIVTSWAPGARETGRSRSLHLTTDEVEFLVETLPKAHAIARAAGVTVIRLPVVPTTKPLPDAPGWWVRFHTTGEDPRPQVVPWEHYANVRVSDLRDADLGFYGPLPLEKP